MCLHPDPREIVVTLVELENEHKFVAQPVPVQPLSHTQAPFMHCPLIPQSVVQTGEAVGTGISTYLADNCKSNNAHVSEFLVRTAMTLVPVILIKLRGTLTCLFQYVASWCVLISESINTPLT